MNIQKICLLAVTCLQATVFISAQKIAYKTAAETGAISQISLENDSSQMNWTLAPDHSQYEWTGKEYGWGLGNFQLRLTNDELRDYKWETPEQSNANGTHVVYRAGDIQISVKRYYKRTDLIEEYTFKNTGNKTLELVDMGINTPFNDNYPDAKTCMLARCNAHIWAGGLSAYVNAMRMGGQAPHLGLVLTQGAIKSYEIAERDIKKPNFRGVIMLNPENITLKPKESYTLAWRIFAHTGWDDFNAKLLKFGGVIAKADKYVYQKGEKAVLTFLSNTNLKNPKLFQNGKEIPFSTSVEILEGENLIELAYGNGKRTQIEALGVSSYEHLIRKRAEFILANQQMKDTADARFGAFMVYDNETGNIFLNDSPSVSPSDRDEGRERVGMGNFLALYYLQHPDENIKKSLVEYADFLRNKLQDSDCKTYSRVDKKSRNRAYNYPWVASFYLRMFQVTGEKQYLQHAYGTLRAMYRQFKHGFYAINIPIELSQKLLRENAMTSQADTLLADFKTMGDTFVQNGTNYPRHEVNYEQSIVAPSVIALLELYRVTGEKRYLESAEMQLPVLEAFSGQQPSYHLNGIAIRHWDGYWFGKRESWGDTFPHYWSTLDAIAFDLYAKVAGKKEYEERAKNNLRNNLCLFTEDGRGSCAYIYPYKVNGKRAQFYDPYANDQDWALYFYLQILNAK
ncbi:MAG: hypothetical protein LBM08_09130 [Dysgonamonadaceae bacterium]|jgi:hypothetical protein|nr:hypothetical protein [Dysgonamonadaceae bacterium]